MKHAFLAALSLALSACAGPLAKGPSVDLRLRYVVLYQNGLGYFERTGVMSGERLTLRFRGREVDDVLKSMVVVEQNLGPNEPPSTVSARLPRSEQASGPEDPTAIELVFSPAARRPVSIAYAVPTAAWKATYRVILPIANPVTLPKKSSALITLINRPVAGEDVLLFRPDPAAPASATHPFRAAQIENRSALGLQPGSVSIFSGGTFVGEGVLTRLLPGRGCRSARSRSYRPTASGSRCT
ncbi:hypothetical protein WME73_10910 [Sorangium sp. So ce302]|uniref:hypothetical protein n=1 Tax=Sorangium sp. So ce302 TaxID=3133297 RepID=UPI003F63D134